MCQLLIPPLLLSESIFAGLPQMTRGTSKVIGGDPKGNNFLYTNGKCVIIRNIDVIIIFFFSFCDSLNPAVCSCISDLCIHNTQEKKCCLQLCLLSLKLVSLPSFFKSTVTCIYTVKDKILLIISIFS